MVDDDLRKRVFERDDRKCVVCCTPAESGGVQVDHITDKQFGGGDEIWNLQLLCVRCHAVKSGQTKGPVFYRREDWIRRLELYDEVQTIGKQRKEFRASSEHNWHEPQYKEAKDEFAKAIELKNGEIKNLDLLAQGTVDWHWRKVCEWMGWTPND